MVAALALAACGGGGDDSATEPTDASVPTSPAATEPPPAAPRCGVEAGEGFDEVECTEPHQAEFVGLVAPPAQADVDAETTEGAAVVAACMPSVEAFVGRPLTAFAIDIAHIPGATPTDDIECWAKAPVAGILVGSIAAVGLEAALGDIVIVAELEPGTCFTSASDDYFGLGRVADCTTPKVDMVVGIAQSAFTGDWPGRDEVVEEYDELCAALQQEADFELIADTTGFIFGSEEEWNLYGRTYAICTVYRPEDFESADGEEAASDVFVGPESYLPGVDAPICLQQIEEGGSTNFFQVECDEPHTSELAAVVELPEGALPNDFDQAVELLEDLCASFVQAYTRYDFSRSGLFVSTRVSGSLGTPVESPVDCIASVTEPVLVGSFQEADLATLLGDVQVIGDLAAGTCFRFVGDATSLGTVAGCTEPGALLLVGTYQMAERDPYPEIDVLRAERTVECARVLAESGLTGDPATLSGSFISSANFRLFGARTATCDISPM